MTQPGRNKMASFAWVVCLALFLERPGKESSQSNSFRVQIYAIYFFKVYSVDICLFFFQQRRNIPQIAFWKCINKLLAHARLFNFY